MKTFHEKTSVLKKYREIPLSSAWEIFSRELYCESVSTDIESRKNLLFANSIESIQGQLTNIKLSLSGSKIPKYLERLTSGPGKFSSTQIGAKRSEFDFAAAEK
jgi:hypothetical protein